MPAPKVLIADELSAQAVAVFKERGVDADVKPGLSKEELLAIIPNYEGLAVRSATKATDKLIAAATKLKVIGRAGIGVDNIDIKAATAKGVIVMNTPFGNSITTAEHAITLMLALARQIPVADRSTHAGKWEKNRFLGTEITGKVLGVIGCGNIGSIVADRGVGLKMRVIAFDPFLTEERAQKLGVKKVELDELFRNADVITLHTPLIDKTRNIVDAAAIAKMKKGVRIINCARGGLVDEVALKAGLDSGHIAGAALDVFVEEPAKAHPLFGYENVVCTPHLGASTVEAQENVAVQVAEQMSDYLTTGAITNALNFPSISAEEAPRLKPFIKLAGLLGSFCGQVTHSSLKEISIEYTGEIASMNTKALTSAAVSGVLAYLLEGANMVSAPAIAKERGITINEATRGQKGAYGTYMTVRVRDGEGERSVAGTVFSDGRPRLIQLDGINLEAEFGANMLYTHNGDKPGYIGALGNIMGAENVNIASFSLGRDKPGGRAIAFWELDQPVSEKAIAAIKALPHVTRVERLGF